MSFIYWRGANVSFVNQASCAGKANIGRTSNKVCTVGKAMSDDDLKAELERLRNEQKGGV